MVLTPNVFEHAAFVALAGYRWFSAKELAVIGLHKRSPTTPVNFDWAFPARERSAGGRDEVVDVMGVEGLYREFAELDTANPESLLSFANKYGELGEPVVLRCDARKTIVTVEGDRTGKGDAHLWCETWQSWVGSVALVRVAVAMLEGIRKRDVKSLRRLFRWQEGSDRHGMRGTGQWVLDTHPELPEREDLPECIREEYPAEKRRQRRRRRPRPLDGDCQQAGTE